MAVYRIQHDRVPLGMMNYMQAVKYLQVSVRTFNRMLRDGIISGGVRVSGYSGKFWAVEELNTYAVKAYV